MSDEESFVILGTSPTPSMDTVQSLKKDSLASERLKSDKQFSLIAASQNEVTSSAITTSSSTESSVFSIVNHSPKLENDGKSAKTCSLNGTMSNGNGASSAYAAVEASASSTGTNSNHKSSSLTTSSLATSFLLGEVETDVLKTSVYSQFPSLCAGESSIEDILKLHNLMAEYVELRETLRKTNMTMRQYFFAAQKWQEDMKNMKEEHANKMSECQQLIAKLRNENLELKNDLETKMEQINLNEEIIKKDSSELVKSISEKSAQINNMRAQIEKLEQQQLKSFEYIQKENSNDNSKHEYVSVLEHERVVKQLKRELSVLLAENLELKDMQKIYIDEINCLKVNSVSTEELLNKAQADINILKSRDIEKSELFDKYEKEKDELKEEMSLLRAQIEVYSKDFELERAARQNLAGEKDQLLADLKLLQRRNHQLIEETQSRLEEEANKTASASAPCPTFSFESHLNTQQKQEDPKDENQPGTSKGKWNFPRSFVCPLCNKFFQSMKYLENHVQKCLDQA